MPSGVQCQQALWCRYFTELAHPGLSSLGTTETIVNLEHRRTKKRICQRRLLFDVLFYFMVTEIIGRTRHSVKQFDCLKLFLTHAAHHRWTCQLCVTIILSSKLGHIAYCLCSRLGVTRIVQTQKPLFPANKKSRGSRQACILKSPGKQIGTSRPIELMTKFSFGSASTALKTAAIKWPHQPCSGAQQNDRSTTGAMETRATLCPRCRATNEAHQLFAPRIFSIRTIFWTKVMWNSALLESGGKSTVDSLFCCWLCFYTASTCGQNLEHCFLSICPSPKLPLQRTVF